MTTACGGEDFQPGVDDESAAACNAFVDTWCTETVRCVVEAGVVESSSEQHEHSECVDAAELELDCEKAVSVGSQYDGCLADVHAIACDDVVESVLSDEPARLPSSCEHVIEVNE